MKQQARARHGEPPIWVSRNPHTKDLGVFGFFMIRVCPDDRKPIRTQGGNT